MNKILEAYLPLIKEAAYNDELEKISKARHENIESELGTIFSNREEGESKKLIKEKNSKSFIAKHPFLTGIPTLGIAPYINSRIIENDILRKLVKKYPNLKERYHKMVEAKTSKPEDVQYTYSLNS